MQGITRQSLLLQFNLRGQFSLLNFGTFSRPLLLQLRDDLVWRVFLPQGPQVLCCQWGAISFHNKPGKRTAGMSHIHTIKRKTQFIVDMLYTLLLQWVRRSLKIRGFKDPTYPVNHQKRIFDRKEASLTGQGFCNRLKTRLTDDFRVNIKPLKGFWDVHSFTEGPVWWLNGAFVESMFKKARVCVNGAV